MPDENDDITEYLTDSSFEELKKRFAEAEEDESIRNEDFNPLSSGKASKKEQRMISEAIRASKKTSSIPNPP